MNSINPAVLTAFEKKRMTRISCTMMMAVNTITYCTTQHASLLRSGKMRSIAIMSVRLHISKTHVQISRNFCRLPVAVARSSSDDSAIRYVLPALWMTSRFHVMGEVPDRYTLGVCDVANHSPPWRR